MTKQRRERIDRKKALANWSKQIRARDGKCMMCGKTEHLNAHHILAKEHYDAFQYEMWNGITLCAYHHKWSFHSPHKNALYFSRWLKVLFPEGYDEANKKLNEFAHIEWEARQG